MPRTEAFIARCDRYTPGSIHTMRSLRAGELAFYNNLIRLREI